MFEQILDRRTAKSVWDSLKRKYGGNDRVKKSMLNFLRREFEVLEMKDAETITEYFARVMTVANKIRSNGEVMSDSKVVQKILRTLTEKFTYVVVSIEESKDTEEMSIDELQSSLVVHEQKFKRVNRDDEQALKVESSRGRGGYRGRGRGRGRQSFTMECFKCHKLGHFQYECPEWNKETNYAELDEGHKHFVKCGNNYRISVSGKGSVWLVFNGTSFLVQDVYYVPELRNNLLSVGQLQEKDLTILIKNGMCNIYHPNKGLIAYTNMSGNRMFILFNKSSSITTHVEEGLHTSSELTYLWHQRYGHLNYKGLKTLKTKKMVCGLPQLEVSSVTCAHCFTDKQHRNPIPKNSEWCASKVEKEAEESIKCLRTDRGGEFNSLNFKTFCEKEGIKRQLTTAYTPHQNGVAERKNRTVMNMVRCMLSAKRVPKLFWAEAAKWTFYLLNRCPTHAVKNITPQEAWSGVKPSVQHLHVWGCIAHVHIPEAKRGKLDDKSFPCIMLGMSDESMGYRLFDPKTKRIVVSKDVIFEEEKSWDWGLNYKEQIDADFVWSNDDLSSDESEGGHESENDGECDDENNDNEEISPRENVTEGREKRPPGWMQDFVSGEGLSEEEEEETYMVQDDMGDDPILFEEAVKHEKWRKAMDSEIKSIEKNQTWELLDLPIGAKIIGVKWIFKTKLNEKGEVDKYKARLVAKGYSQQHGIDFIEVFALVDLMKYKSKYFRYIVSTGTSVISNVGLRFP
ncbi:unnamed protein product [Trifolium pratense]|uniref:Uncharacterized protein n=1 Tax=Trifolium pratense TaxID=57577 RepID=A0ACB0J056_TRIPR|nr:unnamed protein product [Trifolium pratense]